MHRRVAATLARDGQRVICRYFAPDADSVRNANREAALPVEAAFPVICYGEAAS